MPDETGAETLHYVMHTEPELSAEESELYLMAAIDDVTLATTLLMARDIDPRNPPPDFFTRYRSIIRVKEISYENPWDINFVMQATETIASIIGLLLAIRIDRREKEREQGETWETLEQLRFTKDAIDRERSDRSTRQFLADAALKPEHEGRLGDLDRGLQIVKSRLKQDLLAVLAHLASDPESNLDGWDSELLAERLSDNVRLLGSLERLDNVERFAEESQK